MDFVRDLRYAARGLWKSPGFSLVSILCLAVGIGANSTVFSLVDGYWTRPLPVRDPNGLVYLYTATSRGQSGVSYAEYLDYQAGARTLGGLLVSERRGGILTGEGYADAMQTNVVSDSYFQVLGVGAQIGRVFAAGDTRQGRVLVISHNLWQRRFGGDPSVVGRTIRLSGSYTVIGVAPKGFRGVELWRDSDAWIPMSSWDPSGEEAAQRVYRSFTAIGRLTPGTSLEKARAELTGISTRLERDWPKSNQGCRAVLLTEAERLHSFHLPYILMGIVAVVLLIACANVAGLLLARSAGREQEIAVKQAMGASRWRLASAAMAENALLGAAGLLAGLALARGMIAALPSLVIPPANGYLRYEFRLDGRVVGFTVAISLLTVCVFGLWPALRVSKLSRTPRRSWSRQVLVVGQIVLSIVLLAGAGLLVRTFIYCMNIDPGFTRADVLVAELAPPFKATSSHGFYDHLLERAHAIPGVTEATVALRPPLNGSGGGMAQEVTFRSSESPVRIKYTAVGLNYFHTMGIALARGRDFDSRDQADAAKVMIVNQTMARRYWPIEDPVGKTVHLDADRMIVGVAADTRINSIEEPAEPYFYLPVAQTKFTGLYFIARTSLDPLRLARPFRAEVAAIDSRVPVLEVTSMKMLVKSTVYEQQVSATIVGSLGLAGLLLAAIGLYGVVSYTVAGRTREIGIRMALGAQRRDALTLILRQALGLASAGISVGLICAFYAARLLEGMLYGITTRDPITFGSVAVLMLLVTLGASVIPARRATKIEPVVALRYE